MTFFMILYYTKSVFLGKKILNINDFIATISSTNNYICLFYIYIIIND